MDMAAQRWKSDAMRQNLSVLLVVLLLATLRPVTARDADTILTARFIGNEAFAISDGDQTLVSDFPYRSGAHGYMDYDPAALEIEGDVLALITHRHTDHFDPGLFGASGWKIIGPREVTGAFPADRVVPFSKAMRYGNIFVHPLATPHSTTEHFSYLVTWHGLQLYFLGDTEESDEILALGGVDVVFITPWVLRGLLRKGADIPAEKIIIYHQRVGERLPKCRKCRALAQGESFTLD